MIHLLLNGRLQTYVYAMLQRYLVRHSPCTVFTALYPQVTSNRQFCINIYLVPNFVSICHSICNIIHVQLIIIEGSEQMVNGLAGTTNAVPSSLASFNDSRCIYK